MFGRIQLAIVLITKGTLRFVVGIRIFSVSSDLNLTNHKDLQSLLEPFNRNPLPYGYKMGHI